MVGMVGAGKSTICSMARSHLTERGYDALTIREAVQNTMDRSLLGRASRRLIPSASVRGRAHRGVFRLAVRPWHTVGFAVGNLGLVSLVLRALRASPIPWWHRRRIFGLFIQRAAALRFLGHRLGEGEILVLDEGLLHRAVNVFAWSSVVDAAALLRYLGLVPEPQLVLVVKAPSATASDRAVRRGLPKRLAGFDESKILGFFANAERVIDDISDLVEGSESPVVIVDNSGPPDEAQESVRRGLDAWLATATRALDATDGPPRAR